MYSTGDTDDLYIQCDILYSLIFSQDASYADIFTVVTIMHKQSTMTTLKQCWFPSITVNTVQCYAPNTLSKTCSIDCTTSYKSRIKHKPEQLWQELLNFTDFYDYHFRCILAVCKPPWYHDYPNHHHKRYSSWS